MHLKDAARAVTRYMKADIPVMMWGAPGIGKTDFCYQLGQQTNRMVIDWRTNLRDPVDARGLPVADLENNVARWLRPNDLPFEGSDFPEDAIVFLDEVNTASPAMQVVAMQLVNERRVGEHRLKPGVYIIAAGNRQSDKAAAQRMPTALANRLAHIDVEADIDVFCDWAYDNQINPMLIAFLRWRPALLHDMTVQDLRAFPTPRSWARTSRIVDDEDDALFLQMVAGLVGEGGAAEFIGFVRTYRNLPSLDLVLSNPTGAKIPAEPSARFAITIALAHKVTAKTFDAGMTYVRRLPGEFEILFGIDATKRDIGLSHTQTFTDFAIRNQEVMIG